MVEDNPADAGLVRRALEQHKVRGEIVILSDGETAIEFMQSLDTEPVDPPDLIIVDLSLPRRSGREVLENLRLTQKCRLARVIVLSSSDAEQDQADAARLGADRFIRKPSGLDEFIALGAIFKEMLGASAK